ncbi:MAG: ABC transporter permease [Peptococcaceae bacterium]
MELWEIALNNLKRRKGQGFFIVTGITIGIATVVALFSLTTALHDQMLNDVQEAGAKVMLTPQVERASFTFGGITVAGDISFAAQAMPEISLAALQEHREELGIKIIAPKKIHSLEINGGSYLMAGVDFRQELKLKSWLKFKGKLPEGENQVMLGSSVASLLAKKQGDYLAVNGGRRLLVSGILAEAGSQEDNIILAPLPLVEELSGNSNLSLIELVLNQGAVNAADLLAIKKILPDVKVTSGGEVTEARKEVIVRFRYFALLVSFIMLIIAGLVVITIMLASVNERAQEIGIFRALGFKRKDIVKIFYYEAAFTCALGGLLGYGAGIMTARLAVPFIDERGLLMIKWNPILGITMIMAAVMIGLAAGWYPINRGAQADPAEALRVL